MGRIVADAASSTTGLPGEKEQGMSDAIETITLAGGCFWCVEAVFAQVRGVVDVQSGYSNGHAPAPTYEAVCGGGTGHAEVVRVRFDPRELALADLLRLFFATHDPTTLNRQGIDVGSQYRSGIYFDDAAQLPVIERVRAGVDHELGGRVVTEVAPLHNYSMAESYHQRYYANHPDEGYCAAIVGPKLDQFRRGFAERLVG
jgi:peptide-methionine (S)-S-oxide reductase